MTDVPPLSPAKTLGWGLAILAVTAVVHGLTALAMGGDPDPANLRDDGLVFSVGILTSALAGGAFTVWLLRRHAPRVYLALTWPPLFVLILWILIGAAKVAVLEGALWLLGRPAFPDEWLATFAATRSIPPLVLALVVAAPIYEEMYFRGLLHRGLAASRLGPIGAIAVISLLFSAAHFPGDILSLAQGVVLGVLLGVTRWQSGSILPCIIIHAMINAKMLIQLALATR